MTSREYESTAAYVAALAERHGVVYVRTASDEFAETASRLVGDNVSLDKTEELLLALSRTGIIAQEQTLALLNRHLREVYKKETL